MSWLQDPASNCPYRPFDESPSHCPVCSHRDGLDELQQEELNSQRQALTTKWQKQAARQRRSVGGGGGGGEEWDVEQEVGGFEGSGMDAGTVLVNCISVPVIQYSVPLRGL